MAEQLSNSELLSIFASPSLFMWKMLDIKPLPYQVELLEDFNRNILVVGGRQIGKSLTLSAKALWTAFVKKDQDILIIASTLRQAKIVFDHIYRYVSNNSLINAHTKKLTITEIRFDNGSVIRCLPSGRSGEGIRGFSATMVIFDESAFIPDEVFIAVEPALGVKGSQVIYSSTPYGKRGFFYNIYAEQMSRNPAHREFSIYQIKSEENPYFSKEFLEKEKRLKTSAQFAQEYEATFVDESGMFFPFTLVYNCVDDYDYNFPRKTEAGEKLYVGVDVAYSGEDESAIVMVKEFSDGKRQVQYVETIAESSVVNLVGRIINLSKSSQIYAIYVDKTGVGAGVYDMLKSSLGSIVRGVEFTEHNRERMYGNLRMYMENKLLKLSRFDDKMLYQFSSYTSKYDITGKLRIVKDINIHDDLVDALAIVFLDAGGDDVKVLDIGMDLRFSGNLDNRPFVDKRSWFVLGDDFNSK